MKTFTRTGTAWILSAAVLLAPVTARAGDDPVNEKLKQGLASVKALFPDYVNHTYKTSLEQYFGTRHLDYNVLAVFLNEDALLRSTRVHDLSQRASEILAGTDGGRPEESAADLYVKLASLTLEARMAQSRVEEIHALAAAWNDRCGDHALTYPRFFFNPKLLFPVDNIQLQPTNDKVDFTVTVGWSSDPNSIPVGVNTPPKSQDDQYIMAGCTAAGAIAGSVIPGLGTAVGMLIGSLVGSVVVLFKNLFNRAAIIGERNHLVGEIRGTMANIVDAAYKGADAQIITTCQEQMPATTTDRLATVQANLEKAGALALEKYSALQSAYEALAQSEKLRLTQLNQTYFVNLTQQYMALSQEFFKQRAKVDVDARDYNKSTVFPAYSKLTAGKSLSDKAAARQALWDAIILGEARFAPATDPNTLDLFSFNQLNTALPMRGVWTSTLNTVLPELAK